MVIPLAYVRRAYPMSGLEAGDNPFYHASLRFESHTVMNLFPGAGKRTN